jgi:hypothetical protein
LKIKREELRRYGRKLNVAWQTGEKPNLADFPEVQKLDDAAKQDPKLKSLQANGKDLSEKRKQLNQLRVALRLQRAELKKARDCATHDRRAASSSHVTSLRTAVADAYKDFGNNLAHFSSRLLSYEFGFTLFAEVIMMYGVDALLAQDHAGPPFNGTDAAWSNGTDTSGAPSQAGLTKAMTLMAFQGFWFFATVGQRNKALLWPIQKTMYGVSGLLSGFFRRKPPPVVAMPQMQTGNEGPENLLLPQIDATSQDGKNDKDDKGKEAEIVFPMGNRDGDDSSDDASSEYVLKDYVTEISKMNENVPPIERIPQ